MAWFKKDDPRGDLDRTVAVPSQQPLPPPPREASPPAPSAQPAAPVATRPEPAPIPAAEPMRAAPAAPAGLAGLAAAPRQAEPPPSPRVAEQASVFAESVEIEGSLDGDGDVVLRGRVRGSISITGVLVVGETGRVQADVAAREVVNAGVVEGNIQARDRVRVQATGLVQGDIDSPSIVIDDGGGVEGFVAMQPAGGDEEEDDLPARPQAPAAGLLRKPAPAPMAATPPAVSAPLPVQTAPMRAQPAPPTAPAQVAAMPSPPLVGGVAQQPQPQPVVARPPAAGLLFRPAQSPAALPGQPPPASPDATVLVAPRPASSAPASAGGGNGHGAARDPFADEIATGAAGGRDDGPLGGEPASNPL